MRIGRDVAAGANGRGTRGRAARNGRKRRTVLSDYAEVQSGGVLDRGEQIEEGAVDPTGSEKVAGQVRTTIVMGRWQSLDRRG